MKLLMLATFCLLTVASCNERGTREANTAPSTRPKHITYTDSKGKSYKSIGEIPDSLRTPEQRLYVKTTIDVLLNGIAIEDNHMILKYSKEKCLAKGMTSKQYNDLQENLRVNNHYYDSAKVKNVAEMFVDMQKDLKTQLKNH